MDRTWDVPAEVIRAIDGDNVLVRADLGWGVEITTSVRLEGLNAGRGKTTPAALWLRGQLPAGTVVELASRKRLGTKEKYGRVLGAIFLGGIDIGARLLELGFAEPWDGRGEKPGG